MHQSKSTHISSRLLLVGAILLGFFLLALPIVSMAEPVAPQHSDTATLAEAPALAPTSVTLVGDLQSELGCTDMGAGVGGDWEPACTTTHLTEIGNGVWRGAFTVPMGSWEYKMALDNSWDENYNGNHVVNGNTSLEVLTETGVIFYFDDKTKAVLDSVMDEVATAAGDFQSALGCPGDWQPECVRSLLTDVDGDDVYTFVANNIPAGSYEFKVALDEQWTTSYPGDNVAFSVGSIGDEVTITWDSSTNDVTVDVVSALDLSYLATAPATNPIQDQVFYFVMPDRFANGDTSNDLGGFTGDKFDHGFDPTDKGFFHGGDLAGLLDNMDYLENMGVTAIWMTPVFKNKPVQGTGDDISAGYHGYWITDFTQFDPHFGTNEELELVITEAHSRGMKVFFDIITNHTADVIKYEEGEYSYRNKTDYPYKDADGVAFDDRDFVNQFPTFPTLDAAVSFPYTPYVEPEEATVKVPAWLNDVIYYHNRGDTSFSGENSLYGDFFGLDDLFTEHPRVITGLTQIYKDWITNYDIDGFRVDTVKHVNNEFWEYFVPEIMTHAADEGKPDFFVFGEIFSGNPVLLSHYINQAEMPGVLDFHFQEQVVNYVANTGNSNSLRDMFANDDYYIDPDTNAYALPTFIGNHDRGRIGLFLNQGGVTEDAEMLARSQLAHAMMYFARGVPVVYYGDEQGFIGDGGDKDARQNMFPSQVAEFIAEDQIGTTANPGDDNFDTTHPLYTALAEYGNLYNNHKALRYGAQIHRYSTDTAGIYAFSRVDRMDKVEYVLAFNNLNTEQTASFSTFAADANFTAVYTSGDTSLATSLSTDADQMITVTVPAAGFVVYRADEALTATTATPPAVSITSLTSNSEVTLETTEIDGNAIPERVEIAVDVPDNIFAEATFAVRPSGTTTYTVIGVDNNAPYRIFYDVSDMVDDTRAATTLDFAVVVSDVVNGVAGSTAVSTITITLNPLDTGAEPGSPAGSVDHVVIHYDRADGDYGNHITGTYEDYWGLHVWGSGVVSPTEWTAPLPFIGQTEYGQFTWVPISNVSDDIGFIIHKGDAKDGTDDDRYFNPGSDGPQIWLKSDDPNFYTSQAAAQGYTTIRYYRPDETYGDWGLYMWTDNGAFQDWGEGAIPFDGVDADGWAYKTVWLTDTMTTLDNFEQTLNFIVRNNAGDAQSGDQSYIPATTPSVWHVEGEEGFHVTKASAENYAVIHYHRPAGDYGDYSSSDYTAFWGLHTWEGAADPGWTTPRKPAYTDSFGVAFTIPLFADATQLNYILHRGDEKDPGPDQFLIFEQNGYEVWQAQNADPENPYILPLEVQESMAGGDLTKYQAYWLSEGLIAWGQEYDPNLTYYLHYAPEGGITLDTAITAGTMITLTYNGVIASPEVDKFPHLAGLRTYRLPNDMLSMVPEILKGQLAVSAVDSNQVVGTVVLPGDGTIDLPLIVDATGLQIPGVLDDLFYYPGDLGVIYDGDTPTLRLWAPTAKSVKLHVFDTSDQMTATQVLTMSEGMSGTWEITGDATWDRKFYLYEVEVYVHSTKNVENNIVTDPYAVSLAMNSTKSQIVNLDDADLKPEGWDSLTKPTLAAPEDIALYELHVRDFSIHDSTVMTEARGTFKAFTEADSNGMNHLKALADAGLTHIHLLPVFDIATINENPAERVEPDIPEDAAPDSTAQRDAVIAVNDQDGFNWGYDPFHFNVPEGSYSTDADGVQRIIEFREMVQSLNQNDLRVVMDVVYNHTNAAGQAEKSVFDKIVPGYYHRLNADGMVETSTCCQNTATEHMMMQKFMLDSVEVWAEAYKVDGFRFDLMGHHMKENMLEVQTLLQNIDPSIYVYGEGWNFGEVADGLRGENATQINMAGTGIGTFNDRLRDAVRGGGPFDGGESLVTNQGFINGAYYDMNDLSLANGLTATHRAELMLSADQIRVGLAGNLADYSFTDRTGTEVTGSQVDYNGSPSGYNQDPQEHIIYVSAHDNQTLYDNNVYKVPTDTVMADRVRVQNLGLDLTVLAQGVPFFHAGVDMLRSKSLERDSYNSGDWFNKLDFTYMDNNFGVGLPPKAEGDEALMAPFLRDPNLKPTQTEILSSVAHMRDMLQVRNSTPLFRLQTEQDVMDRLAFHNTGADQLPGLIVMSISDMVSGTTDLDPNHEMVVVLFNANDEAQVFTETALVGVDLELHPVQQASADAVVKTATFDSSTGVFNLPARTTVVYVLPDATLPNITITKTVGTEAGVCATDSNLTITGTTIVYYCYTVQNTGGVTLTHHDLVDDQLGTILNGFTYTLAPTASVNTVAAGLTLSATLETTTTNVATWTAYISGTDTSAMAMATATVNFVPDTVGPSTPTIYLPLIMKNATPQQPTLYQLAVDNNLDTLVGALDQAGLNTTLDDRTAGPFTVFAPSEAAFADPATGATLLSLTEEQLTNVLLYHVVDGQYMATEVVSATTLTTLYISKTLSVSVTSGTTVTLTGDTNAAMVVGTDIEAANGVIHVIDAVLVPDLSR